MLHKQKGHAILILAQPTVKDLFLTLNVQLSVDLVSGLNHGPLLKQHKMVVLVVL